MPAETDYPDRELDPRLDQIDALTDKVRDFYSLMTNLEAAAQMPGMKFYAATVAAILARHLDLTDAAAQRIADFVCGIRH